jgi:hypothetical protein
MRIGPLPRDSEAQSAAEWIGVSQANRGDALRDLLDLTDATQGRGARPEPSLTQKVPAVHRSLDGAGIHHAFGGAIAFAYHGVPRATADVDVNVFLGVEGWPQIRRALGPLGSTT